MEVSRILVRSVFDICHQSSNRFLNCSVAISIEFSDVNDEQMVCSNSALENATHVFHLGYHCNLFDCGSLTRRQIRYSSIHPLGTRESQPWPLPNGIMGMDQWAHSHQFMDKLTTFILAQFLNAWINSTFQLLSVFC